MSERATLIEKTAKAQRLVDRGTTDGERAAAAGRVEALKERHGITDDEVAAWIRRDERPRLRFDFSAFIRVPSAEDLAREHGLDARAFRRWLRKEGIIGSVRHEAFRHKGPREDLVARFRAAQRRRS